MLVHFVMTPCCVESVAVLSLCHPRLEFPPQSVLWCPQKSVGSHVYVSQIYLSLYDFA